MSEEIKIAPDVPELPPEAVEFAKEVSELANKYGMDEVSMDVKINTGYGSKYAYRSDDIIHKMNIHVSKKDGRGRPRTQIQITSNINIRVPVVWEPNTHN